MLNYTVNYDGKIYQPHTIWDNAVREGDLFIITDNSVENPGVHVCTFYSASGGMVEYDGGGIYECDCLKLILIK